MAVVGMLVFFGACRQRSATMMKEEIPGRWILQTQRNCTYGPVKSDELTFHSDGTFDQKLSTFDGKMYQSSVNHWSLLNNSRNIALEARWNLPKGADVPRRESESLIIEATNPPSIVIDPDNNCFYQKVRQ